MSYQRPPLRIQTSETPLLSVGGMAWNLSNLCSTQNESYSLTPNRRLDRKQSYQDQRLREQQSLYPSKEELGRYLPPDIDTSLIFERRPRNSPAQPRQSRIAPRHRTQSLPSGTKEFDMLNFPSIYDRGYFQLLSRDPSTCDADDFSDRYDEPQERYYSRLEHGCSHYEVPHDYTPPIPGFISVCSSDVSYSPSSRHSCVERERTPMQVEVYPGKLMKLRGAKETIEAIARGHSKSVSCYACGLGLRCVADCELVICPECRIMSPVLCQPTSLFEDAECEHEEEDTSYRYLGSMPRLLPLWRDDDESFHSYIQKSNVHSWNRSSLESTGGVGLGLKIEQCR